MPRLNVEDSVWLDPRFKLLEKSLGSRISAIGTLVEFWRLAQEYWVRGKNPVPLDIFKAYDLPEALVECCFAVLRNDGVHACGAAKQFAWIKTKHTAGKKGGLASGRSRQKKAKELHIDKSRSKTEANAKQTPSETNPLTLTLTPSLTLTHLIQGATALQSHPEQFESKNPVAIWCEEYRRKYGTAYEVMARDGGMLRGFGKTRGQEKMRTLFACYLAIDEPLYSSQKHPLSLFFRDLPKITNAAQTGIDPSKPKPFDLSKLRD